MTRGKILVIRGGAIGDFILTLPVLAALRAQFPNADLEVMGYEHIASLAVEGVLASAVRRIDARPLAGFFAEGGDLDSGLRQYFATFSVIVSYLYDPDEIFQKNVARCSKAQFIVGPHRPDEKRDTHACEVYLKPLERLAIFDADPVPAAFVAVTVNEYWVPFAKPMTMQLVAPVVEQVAPPGLAGTTKRTGLAASGPGSVAKRAVGPARRFFRSLPMRVVHS